MTEDQFLRDQLMKNLYKAKGWLMVNYHMLMLTYCIHCYDLQAFLQF